MAASRNTEETWPCSSQIEKVRKAVAIMAKYDHNKVKIALSPYRVCPLGAHIDHQGGTVTAMAINRGVILGFAPSFGFEMLLRSEQFGGEVKFRIDDVPPFKQQCDGMPPLGNASLQDIEEGGWGNYARGAVVALQRRGHVISQGIVGFVDGLKGFHGAGVSSSAAVGIAFLLALEHVNDLHVSQQENIELDRLIENGYLGLRNGVLDQSAILLSQQEVLTVIHCKDQMHELVYPQKRRKYKILLAFSGLRHALTSKTCYNMRVNECQQAAQILLRASMKKDIEPLLGNVSPEEYERHKRLLEGAIEKRAKHFFTEHARVFAGIKAWSSGDLEEFGKLMSESGKSSIEDYECGCEPMKQLLDILLKSPGVFGARFSGAGFRGCCIALVDEEQAEEAMHYVLESYRQVQPVLSRQLENETAVLVCETGGCARLY